MKLFLHVHTRDRQYKTVTLRDAWEESKHPRGQPGNAGQFVSGGSKSSPPTQRTQAPQASPPQERKASEYKELKPGRSVSVPAGLSKYIKHSGGEIWTFGSGDRYQAYNFEIETPTKSAQLLTSRANGEWMLFLPDQPSGKDTIYGDGQEELEKTLKQQGLLTGSEPKPVKLPKGVKATAKQQTKTRFAGNEKEEDATAYALDQEGYGRRYLLTSNESDAWKIMSAEYKTPDAEGYGQESLNNELSDYAVGEKKKPTTGSQADFAASQLSKIRVSEAVHRFETSHQTYEDKHQALTDIGQAVREYMHIHPSVGYRIGQSYKFKVGDKEYSAGGHFSPSKNEVMVCDSESPHDVDKLIAHEFMHSKFHAVKEAYAIENQAMLKDERNGSAWVCKPSGEVREEYKKDYPLHTIMPDGFGPSVTELKKDDGCTDYSRAYWEAVTKGGERGDPLLATNETLAEMAKLDREGSLPRLLWYKNSKVYKKFYQDIHDMYPHAVKILNP